METHKIIFGFENYRNVFKRHIRQTLVSLLIITVFVSGMNAQDRPPDFVRKAVGSVEKMLDSQDESSITTFIEQSMVDRDNQEKSALIERLKHIRHEMRGLRDDLAVEMEHDGVRLMMSDGQVEKRLKIILDFNAGAISDLYLLDSPEPMNIEIDKLAETFDRLEKDGFAGVIYVKINDEVIIKRAFGPANKDLAYDNQISTVFGTGSRPIDYTVAAIYLLDQKGVIKLDDRISKYFRDVPEDKASVTIRHLLTGQSGLPDFFHTSEDWDPDLAWVDRETAVERLLSQELLFEPGTARAHSHGAFGLLAALIEMVSDTTYFGFIHKNFFEPAGMGRTFEYGETKGLAISEFAAGGGPQSVGLPNIPPNWGPTSWLIKGSGGMCSTLDDLLKFYNYLRSGDVLDMEHNKAFHQAAVNIDGSDRGFELFSAFMPPGNEIYLFLNEIGDRDKSRQLFSALERLAESSR